MSMYVGNSQVGDGDEVAHVDVLIGARDGPVGAAFAHALVAGPYGHSSPLAVLAPNLPVKPPTVVVTKVILESFAQAAQVFGPAQYAVARAVADSVAAGVIPGDEAETLCIVARLFLHPQARDENRIRRNNYQATKQAIASALRGLPAVDEVILKREHSRDLFIEL
jgi:5,6,7,8-tetrahydromethanopterin hydro-lyase